jgi:hypothetical protein
MSAMSRTHRATRAILLLAATLFLGCQTSKDKGAFPATGDGEHGTATRMTLPGCDPGDMASEEFGWVGKEVLVTLLWNDMPASAGELQIPMTVVAVSQDGLVVDVHPLPMREKSIASWQTSGHLTVDGDEFVLDPCSATLTAMP